METIENFKEVLAEYERMQKDGEQFNEHDKAYYLAMRDFKKLILCGVSSSFNLEIKDKDIATIEALHDTLLDEKILGLNARSMKESRALTQRMYKALSKD